MNAFAETQVDFRRPIERLNVPLVSKRLSAESRTAQELALGLSVRYIAPRLGTGTARQVVRRLIAAILNSQYAFFVDYLGRPAGFVSWVFVDSVRDKKLRSQGSAALHSEEMHCGGQLWIIDFAPANGYLRPLVTMVRHELFRARDGLSYARVKAGRTVTKHLLLRPAVMGTSPPPQSGSEFCSNVWQEEAAQLVALPDMRRAAEIGACLEVLHRSPVYAEASLADCARMIRRLVALTQFRLYRSPGGHPIGLLTWMWLSPYTISRISDFPLDKVNPAEWNEGSILCVCHAAAATKNAFKQMERDIHHGLFSTERVVLLYLPATQNTVARFLSMDRSSQKREGTCWLRQVGGGHV